VEPDLASWKPKRPWEALLPGEAAAWPRVWERAQELRIAAGRDLVEERPRVALCLERPLAFAAAVLALRDAPVDAFFWSPQWGRRERVEAAALAAPHWVVRDARDAGLLAWEAAPPLAGAAAEPASGGGMRAMIPTGGSGGRTRFAIHDGRTLAAAALGFRDFFGGGPVASHCVLPLHHVSGFMQLARAFLTEGAVAFGTLDSFVRDASWLLEREERPFLSLVPTQLERLLRGGACVSLLRRYGAIFVGGGPASEALLAAARAARLPLAPTYGMTETAAQVATLRPEAFLAGAAGAGRSLPHARIEVAGEGGAAAPAGPARPGRLRVFASSLFRGYWGEPARPGGAFDTDDLGWIDEGGDLRVWGRADQAVVTGGEKVAPREVELCLERTGLVREAAVFGVPDREWGTRLCAAYVPRESGLDEERLKRAVAEELARHKAPKLWLRLEALPRRETGKVDRRRLLEMAASLKT